MIGIRGGIKGGIMGGVRIGIGADPIASQGPSTTTSLSLTLVDSADPVLNTNNFTYTAQVTNTGSLTALRRSAWPHHARRMNVTGSRAPGDLDGRSVTAERRASRGHRKTSLAVGAANPIVVTVTAAQSADVTATSSAQLTCANAQRVNALQAARSQFVAFDATAGVFRPADATQAGYIFTAAGVGTVVAGSIYNCHDASGGMVDALGAISLTSSGTGLSFQQAVAGSASLGSSFTEAGSGSIKSVSGRAADTSATSCLCWLLIISTLVATRIVSRTRHCGMSPEIIVTHKARIVAGTTTDSASNPTGSLRPWVTQVNRSGTPAVFLFTDQDKVAPTFGTPTGKQCAFGAWTATSPAMTVNYGMRLDGVNAELTTAQIKTLLQTLKWAPAWS